MDNIVWIFKQIVYLGGNATVLALIIFLVKKLFNKALTPKWHYYIWILLIIRLMVPFYIQSHVSMYNLFYPAAQKINLPNSIMREVKADNDLPSSNYLESNSKITVSQNKTTNSQKPALTSSNILKKKTNENYSFIVKILACIWISGVLIILGYTIFVNLSFVSKIRGYKNLNNARINFILEDCKNIMNVKHDIRIFSSDKPRTPSLYGFFNPKILVYEEHIEALSNNEIKYIFLHELSHYKRKDIILNWIIVLLQIVHFFNPIIVYAFYKMHEDCEISCDAAALKYLSKSEYQDYGRTIIKLLKFFSESNFIPVTSGISKNKSSYKRRIIMINEFKKKSWSKAAASIILVASVAVTGLTSCRSAADLDLKNYEPKQPKAVSTDKANTNSKNEIQNATSKNADDVNRTTVDENITNNAQQTTNGITKNPPSKTSSNSTAETTVEVYQNKNLGLSITFPSNWNNKYIVKETANGISVCFKPVNKVNSTGLFFTIRKKTSDLNEEMYDSVAGKREITVNGISYFLGGPTDIGFPDDNPEFKTYRNLQEQLPSIVNSIKPIN